MRQAADVFDLKGARRVSLDSVDDNLLITPSRDTEDQALKNLEPWEYAPWSESLAKEKFWHTYNNLDYVDQKILAYLEQGKTSGDIAERLNLSEQFVVDKISEIQNKFRKFLL